MLFNSYIFILCFLPLTMIGYYGLNHWKKEEQAKWFLIIASLLFYGYFDIRYLPVILASICFNYGFSRILLDTKYEKHKRTVLTAGIICNAGLLFYIKYWNFFLENINAVFGSSLQLKQLLLPLGISFFTFQQISYVVDCYREKDVISYTFVEYAAYVTFFPQLVAGPIVMHSELVPQMCDKTKKRINYENLSVGLYALALGLGKKVLLADTLALVVNEAYFNRYYFTTWSVIVFILAYAFELYFDFSGYCDIAMGIGKMFNYDIPRNFNYPYRATSMKEFWNRWHMTLSGFLQKYIYFPLGGSRKGLARSILNILIVFLISGIWHGAAWNFIIWGLYFVVFLLLEKLWLGAYIKKAKIANHVYVLFFVMISFIIFDATSMQEAGKNIAGLFGIGTSGTVSMESIYYLKDYLVIFLVAIVGATPLPKKLYEKVMRIPAGKKLINVAEPILMIGLLLAITAFLVDGSFNPFLYFRF